MSQESEEKSSWNCKGIRKNPFREWKRKAIEENSDTLANILKEQEKD